MKALLKSQLLYYVLWVAGLLLLVALRPERWSPLYFGLMGPVLILAGVIMWRSRVEAVQARKAYTAWEERLNDLAPTIDVEDDGHLYEWLDPPQWDAVFSHLENLPREARSLRQAMEAIAPGSAE